MSFKDIASHPTQWRNYDLDDIINLDKAIVFVEDKFKAPLMGGNVVFRNFSTDVMSGDNRGFLVVKDTKEIYMFNGRYYENTGEAFLRDAIQTKLGISCCSRYKNETIDWIKDHGELQEKREDFDAIPTDIVLENCVYDVLTGKTKDFGPDNLPTTAFPIVYDPKAKCPIFMKFLEDVHYLEDIDLIQEMFGFCFYKPYSFQKAFMLVGGGANGKSTELNILGILMGERNMCNIPLQSICRDRFTNIDLVGKHANICGDLSEKGLKDTSTFLKLTGGDWIRAEKKYAPKGIYFRNTAKLVFSCNLIPECKNQTFAYKRRWVVVEFPNVFVEDDPNTDPFIEQKLIKEIPGIFNWAMIGLKRLLKNGMFSPHKTLDEVQKYMATNQDSVNQFCMTCVKKDVEGVVLRSEVYDEYIKFCNFLELKMVASNQFANKLMRFGPPIIKKGQSRVLKGKTWKGIKVNQIELETKKDKEITPLKSGLYINGVLVPPDITDKDKNSMQQEVD